MRIVLGVNSPQNLDGEAALLGALITDASAIDRVADILRPEHFTREFNSSLYRALLSLYRDDIPIDNVSVAARYEEQNNKPVGHRAVIATLVDVSLTTSGNARYYAENIIDIWKRRKGISILKKGIEELGDMGRPMAVSIARATEEAIALAGEAGGAPGIAALGTEALPEARRRLETARSGGGPVGVVPYPWPALSGHVPLRPGEVTVVCGRPGMAKTSFALGTALGVARDGLPVGIFSLEMSKSSLALRLISTYTGIDSSRIEKGKTTEEEHGLVLEAIEALSKLPIHIDDSPDLDEIAFISKSREAHSKFKLKLIILDYLTLMARKKTENDVVAVGSCARTVRKTARMLDIPIIEICQVSRNCEYREDKRPVLSDLRESGEIEQEADIVLALYRDEYYTGARSKFPEMCEVIVLKHRNGPLGVEYLQFTGRNTRFESPKNISYAY